MSEAQQWQEYRKQLAETYKQNAPEIPAANAPPAKPDNDNMKQFGSLASIIGIFASAFTKRPMVNALNASADAMKAEQEGNNDAYEKAYREWKDQNELALKRHDMEVERLQEIVELSKTDQAAALAQLKAYGAANGSDAAAILSELGDWSEIGKYVGSMQTAGLKIREVNAKIEEDNAKKTEKAEQQKIKNDYINAWKDANPNATPLQLAEQEAKALRLSQGKTSGGAMPFGILQKLTLQQTALSDGLDAADDALNALTSRAARAGLHGSLNEYTEPLSDFFGSDTTSQQLFVSNIDLLKMSVKNAMTYGGGSSKSLKADYDYLNSIVGGDGMKQSTAGTVARIKNIQDKVLLPNKRTIDKLLDAGEQSQQDGQVKEIAPETSNWQSDDIISTDQ